MKNIFLKGVILAAILVFLFKGGIRLMIVSWRLFLPIIAITILYFIGRQLLLNKKKKEVASGDKPIVICSHCQQPRGSCPKCRTERPA